MTNEHLNAETMDRYLAGERAVAKQHLDECAACRREVDRVESALAGFRDSARQWSEHRRPVECIPSRRTARRRLMPARWAAIAAAAAILVAAVPLYRNYAERRADAQAKADTVLLEEISADISRPAPETLEPLIKLVSQ